MEIAEKANRKSFFYYLVWVAAHAALYMLLFTAYRVIQDKPALRSDEEILANDADLYRKIVENGYHEEYKTDKGIIAFFPGFPWLWKYSGLSVQGIAILNIFLFIFGMAWLSRLFQFTIREVLLGASLPPMLFMYTAYSEALFFVEFTLILYGLKKNNTAAAAIGIFLCCVTRSSANVFVPALVLMILLSGNRHKWRNGLIYILTAIAGVLLVAWVQYIETGQVFGFVEAQKLWGHRLQWPRLPFTSWGNMIWFDMLALVCGMAAVITGAIWFFRWIGSRKNYHLSEPLVFSTAYLAGLTLLALAMKGGSLFSLNRYLMPGAAFLLCMVYFTRRRWTLKQLALMAFGAFAVYSLMHPFRHIQVFLLSIGMQVYFMLYAIRNNSRYSGAIFYILYVFGLGLQVYLADAMHTRLFPGGPFNWVA